MEEHSPASILEILSAGSQRGAFAFSGTDMDDENRDFIFDVPTHMADALNSVESKTASCGEPRLRRAIEH